VAVPHDFASLEAAGNRAIDVTAWQYAEEHPGTDLPELLSQLTLFADALTARSCDR
jgi:hypothetical protein